MITVIISIVGLIASIGLVIIGMKGQKGDFVHGSKLDKIMLVICICLAVIAVFCCGYLCVIFVRGFLPVIGCSCLLAIIFCGFLI